MQLLNFPKDYNSNSGKTVLHGMASVISLLDLLIRESIQNSFDAKLPNKNHLIEKIYCGEFNYNQLSSKYDEIQSQLLEAVVNKNYNKFICIRDYNTTGLTGPIIKSEVNGDDWGKFLNLVRNFGKSKKEDGSGGSWGYGKTIFYKLGLGIVIYYTRIKNNDEYEERLISCLVESEIRKDGLLYDIQNPANTGIAWWGKLDSTGKDILPIIDSKEIKEVLDCFKLKPYENDETGTTVIIPFLDDKYLLNSTSIGSIDEKNISSWCYSLEKYLNIAFQKWYPTRCDNDNGKIEYIETYINDKKIDNDNMWPLFSTIQSLYNYHYNVKETVPYEIFNEEINYSRGFAEKRIGNLYYCLLGEEELEMCVPFNKESPREQLDNIRITNYTPQSIICYCRKPGMIIRYDVDSNIKGSIKSPDPQKFLIGIFIPNSNNYIMIDGKKLTIEEYLRAGESAEHDDWENITDYVCNDDGTKLDCSKIKLVNHIKSSIVNKISGINKLDSEDSLVYVGSGLSKKLGDWLLPKKGFGNRPGKELPESGKTSKGLGSKKNKIVLGNFSIEENCQFGKEYELVFNKSNKVINIVFKVSTENGNISIEDWEENYKFPLVIEKVTLECVLYRNGILREVIIVLDDNFENSIIRFEKLLSANNTWYGFKYILRDTNVSSIKGKIVYSINDSTISSELVSEKGENDE